jgi:hypothetical protein
MIRGKMKTNKDKKRPLHFETDKSKEELKREIALSLTPEERLQKLNRMIRFNKQFSENYQKAFQKRLEEGNTFILK